MVSGRAKVEKWAAVIGMDGKLEYLIKTWKQICISLWNTEPVGAVTVKGCKDISVRKLREETLGAQNVVSVGDMLMEGNQLGERQELLIENHCKQWEQPVLATRSR